MKTEEIEERLIEHINSQGGVITTLGKLVFTNSDIEEAIKERVNEEKQ